MTRQEEINEFMTILNTLTKKYNVSLLVSVNDLTPKEVKKEPKVVEAEVV